MFAKMAVRDLSIIALGVGLWRKLATSGIPPVEAPGHSSASAELGPSPVAIAAA